MPVAQLHLISRYSGGPPETAPLHDLGSGQWDKAKHKAAARVRDTAAELLDLYAQRALREGHAFNLKQHDYEAFAGVPVRGDRRTRPPRSRRCSTTCSRASRWTG